MTTWRLLDTPPMPAAENMVLDATLLELKDEGRSPNTIRFLEFSPRAVLVGYHQSVAEGVRRDDCREHGIQINCRITGGGAILFDESRMRWDFGIGADQFDAVIDSGEPFRTSGCPGYDGEVACNRPYANSRPGPNIRNYPFPPTPEDIRRIRSQMNLPARKRQTGTA